MQGQWVTAPNNELLYLVTPERGAPFQTARLSWNPTTKRPEVTWSRGISLEVLTDGVAQLTAMQEKAS